MLCLLLWQVHLGSVYPVSSSSKRWVWVQCWPPNTTPDSGMWRYTTHARAAPCPPSIYPPTSGQQTTPPPHFYYPFQPQHESCPYPRHPLTNRQVRCPFQVLLRSHPLPASRGQGMIAAAMDRVAPPTLAPLLTPLSLCITSLEEAAKRETAPPLFL